MTAIYGQDLEGADVRSFEFKTFEDCNLRRAILCHWDLEEIHFVNCDLRDATFEVSDLTGCTFDGCQLEGASFRDTHLIDCSFLSVKSLDADDLLACCAIERCTFPEGIEVAS